MARPKRPVNVVFIPSVSGGLGHVARTVKLARALERADRSLEISYVLDELHLRPINVDAVERTGYPVRILPNPIRHERDEKIRAVLGEADVVIEDTHRRLIPHRRILPRLRAWISIPMLPLWDELFMDWPLLDHVDRILYAYPQAMPVPEELEPFRDKLIVTGPILDADAPADPAAGRRQLGLSDRERYVIYSPRGFPFGPKFGCRVMRGLAHAFTKLHAERPELRLVLSAVTDADRVRPPGLPPLDQVDGVIIQGMVSPEEYRDCLAGANLAIVEGTSTLFDAAILRTPVLMVPGTIWETGLEGELLAKHDAGVMVPIEDATPKVMTRRLREALEPTAAAARSERLHALIGTDGRDRAVEAVLRVIREKVCG